MTHPLVAALEGRFQDVLNNQWSLNRRLQAIADEVRTKSPDFATAVDHFVARLAQAEAGAGAPAVGEVLPDFAMPDQYGRIVRLSEIIADGPTILSFHRGTWRHYCILNRVGLAELKDLHGYGKTLNILSEN